MKKVLFLGVLSVFLILAACGKEDTYSDLTLDGLKEFVSKKETGFVLFTYDTDDMETNKEQVSKALAENDKKSNYFNYREEVSNEQSSTFQHDVGTEQSRDSLGYYENGVLMAEFEMPSKWDENKIEDLNKYIVQISE